MNWKDFTEREATATIDSDVDDVSLIVKKNELDLSDIPDYTHSTFKFAYRPQNLKEFIGQEKAKQLVELALKRHKVLEESVHIFLSGAKGHGKTTLAKIICNEMNGCFFYRTGAQLENLEEFARVLKTMYYADKYPVLFIDEVHTLPTEIIEEYLYTLMEDFRIGNKSLREFTLICATTEEDVLAKKLPPFMDRFNILINLEPYNYKDIYKIIYQYQEKFLNYYNQQNKKLLENIDEFLKNLEVDTKSQKEFEDYIDTETSVYKMAFKRKYWKDKRIPILIAEIGKQKGKEIFYFTNDELRQLGKTENGKKLKEMIVKELVNEYLKEKEIKAMQEKDLETISKNSRLTPRIAINLLKSSLVGGVEFALRANRIIKEGLTDIDFKILETLANSTKPIGEEALALTIGLTRSKYRDLYEPYLLSQGYIRRTLRGRIITEKGKTIIGGNNEV